MQLVMALVFCMFALTSMLVNLLWPVIFGLALVVGIWDTALFGFNVYSLFMLSFGMYLLTLASRPSMQALETWTDKQLHNHEDS